VLDDDSAMSSEKYAFMVQRMYNSQRMISSEASLGSAIERKKNRFLSRRGAPGDQVASDRSWQFVEEHVGNSVHAAHRVRTSWKQARPNAHKYPRLLPPDLPPACPPQPRRMHVRRARKLIMKKILEQLGMYRADDIKPLKKPREYSSALRHRRRPPSPPARSQPPPHPLITAERVDIQKCPCLVSETSGCHFDSSSPSR